MAHMIGERDAQFGLAQAWHGLTRVVEAIDTLTIADDFLYPQVCRQLQFENELGDAVKVEAKQIVSLDDELPIGLPVGMDYKLLTNKDIWEAIARALIGTRHEIVSAGSVRDRELCFVSIKLADSFTDGKGNETQPYLNIQWGHGSKFAVYVVNVATKIVCANTFTMSLNGNKLFKMKHTKNADELRIEEAIDAHFGVAQEFDLAMQEAESKDIAPEDARKVFAGFISQGREAKTQTGASRLLNTTDRLCELFQHGKGNFGSNRLDVYHAGTDYYSHESSGYAGTDKFDQGKQFVSSEFGTGAERKNELLSIITQDDEWTKTRENGEKVLHSIALSQV